jgi:hypothetical protein
MREYNTQATGKWNMRRGKGQPPSLTCLFLVGGVLLLSNDVQPMLPAATSEEAAARELVSLQLLREIPLPNGATKMTAREATTITEFWGLTEGWIDEFFDKPDSYIQQYFDIPLCSTNPDCVNMANDILRNKKSSWAESEDMGKILVTLTYIIGSSIMQERANLKWIIRCKGGFLSEISIGDESTIMDIFSDIANFGRPSFILGERGFDILLWKNLLKFRENRDVPEKKPASEILIRWRD